MMLYRPASTYSVAMARSPSVSVANAGRRKVKAGPSSSKLSRVAVRTKDSEDGSASKRSRTELMYTGRPAAAVLTRSRMAWLIE